MNSLNKELNNLREEQKKIRAEAVEETEAKNKKVVKDLEDKLEAALAVELKKREAAEDSLATEVGRRKAVETVVASLESKTSTEVEEMMMKNRDLEDKLKKTEVR